MTTRALTLRRRHEAAAVAFLLALHGWLALSSSLQKSAVFDEVAHVGGGVLQWQAGDYRFNAESGVLLQRWATWPLAGEEVSDLDDRALRSANVWALGRAILYGDGRRAGSRLLAARSMIVLLSLALGTLVYLWSRTVFGVAGGLVSAALYAVSPTMLAHARLVTADLAAALFFMLASATIWRLLARVTGPRALAAALAVAGLLSAKMSGLLILPMAGILILIRLAQRRPLEVVVGAWQRKIGGLRHQTVALAGLVILVGCCVFAALWAAYGLRYAAEPSAPPEGSTFLHSWESLLERESPALRALAAARDARLLPEAYLWGLAYTFDTTRDRDAFLRGQTRDTGWWWFFPYALAVKTPLGLFALLGLAALAWWRERDGPELGLTAPLWTLIGVYGLVALFSQINIGQRHILPLYPALFVFAGGAGRWITRRSRLAAALVGLSLAAVAWASWSIRPHYLSFFNRLVGGADNGYRHLVDSSLDWGQDLPALALAIDEVRAAEGSEVPVYAGLFGAAPPPYHGIDAVWLYSFFSVADPRRPPPPLAGGIYCVSATLLQTMHMELAGPWSSAMEKAFQEHRARVDRFRRLSADGAGRERLLAEQSPEEWMRIFRTYDRLRSGRLYRFLQTRRPDTRAGYSIHLYRLSDSDVARALNSPL